MEDFINGKRNNLANLGEKIVSAKQLKDGMVEICDEKGNKVILRGNLVKHDEKTVTVTVDGKEVVYDIHGIPVKKDIKKP